MPITYTSSLGHVSPNITIEIAFASEPFASSLTWTDVTDYVDQHNYPITIERGRADAQDAAAPGICTLVLNNDDKRFTPGYTGGTYGSNVKVGKAIRITETHNSTSYRRFFGHISSFDLGWPGGVTQQNRVQVTAVDLLGVMSQFTLRQLYDHVMLTTSPVACWPLDDHAASSAAQELTGYRQPGLRKVIRAGGGTCRFDDGKGIPVIPEKWSRTVRMKSDRDSNSWTALGADVDLQSATSAVGFGGWVRFDRADDDEASSIASLTLDDGGDGDFYIGIAATGKGRAAAYLVDSSGLVMVPVAYGPRIADGRWHHVYVTWNESGALLTLFVDGEEVDTYTYAASPGEPIIPATTTITIGAARRVDGTKETDSPTNARFAYWGVWTDATATNLDPNTLYEAGLDDHGKDRTSARISRVLDWMGVPTGRQDVQRGLSTCSIGNFKGMNALEYVTQVTAAEQGFMFQAGDGTFTFQSRSHRWDTASSATLSWHQPDETFTTDLDQYVTSVEVTHARGSVRVSDRTAAATYGPRELEVDAALADPEQAKGIADYVLALRSSMLPRLSQFTYDLVTEDTEATRDAVLGIELGDRITLSSLPTQAHASSVDVWVEGIREVISMQERTVTFITSPWKDFTGFWQLGVTALDDPATLAY